MLAANYNITLDRVADYSIVLTILQADGVTPVDLTGVTVYGEVRDARTKALKFNFTSTVTTPLTGMATLSLTSVQTKTLLAGDSLYEYDFFATIGSKLRRLLYGSLSARREVTKVFS